MVLRGTLMVDAERGLKVDDRWMMRGAFMVMELSMRQERSCYQ